MHSKVTFFSQQHLIPDSPTLDEFDKAFRETILSAYEQRGKSLADAKLYLALQGVDLSTLVHVFLTMEQTGLLTSPIEEALFYPVGCGDIANTLCMMMSNDTLSKKQHPLTELQQALERMYLPLLIRIDIPGHSYVMLAGEKTSEGVFGYIYQSNVAFGMEDNSFSIAAWLMDAKSQKTNLSEHIKKALRLLHPATTDDQKATLYRELYFAKPLTKVQEPAKIELLVDYINEHPTGSYSSKAITITHMIQALEEIKKMTLKPDEKMQSVLSYIDGLRATLPELTLDQDESETVSPLV